MSSLMLLLALLTLGCSAGAYECGTLLNDSTEVHQCDRNHEVCICGTRSCAFELGSTKVCPSGFQYSDKPFVSDDQFAKQCVPVELIDQRITVNDAVKTCPPADAGIDASSDGGVP